MNHPRIPRVPRRTIRMRTKTLCPESSGRPIRRVPRWKNRRMKKTPCLWSNSR